MIKLVEKAGKQFTKLSYLTSWEKNPRGIRVKDFERLKAQIEKFGQYKPLLITPEGIVLGGNMRLKAFQVLEVTEVWVSIVEPKNEAEMFEYSLSDNDRAGYYEDDQLAELIQKYRDSVPPDLYKVDLAYPLDLQRVLDQFGPVEGERGEDDPKEINKELERYLHGTIRQIVLYFTIKDYQSALERIKKITDDNNLEDNTAVFNFLLDFYEKHFSN